MYKKLLINTLLFGVGPYLPQIVSVFLLPVMTRYLTATDYGIAGTINAYTQGLAALSTLGFSTVLTMIFFRSKHQYKILWREIYGFLQYWMIIFAILQGTILYFLIPSEAAEYKWLIIFLTNFSNVFFGATSIVGNTYYTLTMNPLPIVMRSVIGGVVTVLANYVLVVHYRLGYLGWYVGGFVGTFIVNASYWYAVNLHLKLTPILNFKIRTIYKYLKIAMPTIPHYYSVYLLNTSNKIVMNAYACPINAIGQANIVTQIGGLFDTWVSAINQAINPMTLEEIRNRNEQKARSLIYVYLCMTFFTTFFASLWSREMFSVLLSNAELASTYPYAIIFIMALNYRPMYVACYNIFLYNENTASLFKISFIAGLIALTLYCILIPFWGVWGVVIGFYIGCLYFGYSGFFFEKFRAKTQVIYPYKRILFLQLSLTVVALKCATLCVLFKLIISFVIILLLISYMIVGRYKHVYSK